MRGLPSTRGLLRPPWAVEEYLFVDKCVQCGDCAKACEENIILLNEHKQPYIDFNKGECTFCEKCLHSCEAGALVESKTPWQAIAKVTNKCLGYQQTMCRSCGEICEKGAVKFSIAPKGISIPTIESEQCNGCGACVAICPTQAIAVN